MSVVGTFEPRKFWTYIRRASETTNERIRDFQFIPTTNAEVDCLNLFYDEFNGTTWFAVAPDSKLLLSFKDFYVVPLATESPMPLELTTFVEKK